ncbi:MAG: hypothetical protein WCH99_16460 [Verrucomicrobiota bacterium]
MKLRIIKILLALAAGPIFLTNLVFAADSLTNSVGQTNETSPFQIIVTPRKTRVQVMEPFKISIAVKNVSHTDQSFVVWSCSWPMNWKSSNPAVEWVGWSCAQNGAMKVNLASGESFKETLFGVEKEMRVAQSISTNKISFRMALHPGAAHRFGQSLPEDEKGKLYWSNEVTIDLIPN